ncbi:MAG: thiamine-phosphate kinase [Gammaproteobacteria bacterium]|nr:thiamine-phosphate kinase [Gammaproteobacteria bacterium]
MSSEFSLIEYYFKRRAGRTEHVPLGIGDDCALLNVPAGHQLAVSIDTLAAGVHFPHHTSAFDVGHKSLAVGLSDLAAMGAEPAWATLSLSLPELDPHWLEAFSEGFFQLAERHQLTLVGGDTVKAPLSITVQVHGFIPVGAALRRDGAQVGDLICVSGRVGDGALGLKMALGELAAVKNPLQKLNRPEAQVVLGLALRGKAHSCIDVSDGLAADLGHILTASKVGALLQLDKLPLSAELCQQPAEIQEKMALFGGDDYELCFTLSAKALHELQAQFDLPKISVIGQIEPKQGLRLQRPQSIEALPIMGFDHFDRA